MKKIIYSTIFSAIIFDLISYFKIFNLKRKIKNDESIKNNVNIPYKKDIFICDFSSDTKIVKKYIEIFLKKNDLDVNIQIVYYAYKNKLNTFNFDKFKDYCNNIKTRFIIFSLFIINEKCDFGHFNVLVYDTKYKSLERFEPYGFEVDKKFYNPFFLDKTIKNFFGDTIKEYFTPKDFIIPNVVFNFMMNMNNLIEIYINYYMKIFLIVKLQ